MGCRRAEVAHEQEGYDDDDDDDEGLYEERDEEGDEDYEEEDHNAPYHAPCTVYRYALTRRRWWHITT